MFARALVIAMIVFPAVGAAAGFPQDLRDTGLYEANVRPFTPQFPLWSDGAAKSRWVFVPPGGTIDASDVDRWQFPPGTKFWKQFSFGGRPVETRFIERSADGKWEYATYVWNQEGSRATLADAKGIRDLAVAQAPAGRYSIPSRRDCLACHTSDTPVIGFSAVQLAGGGAALRDLLRQDVLRAPLHIAGTTEVERAALGYLHGNCAHCHNDSPSRAPVALNFALKAGDPQRAARDVLASAVSAPARFRREGDGALVVIAPGAPAESALIARVSSRDAFVQMPPLATEKVDEEAVRLLTRWIAEMPTLKKTP
jgi:hypothetical protein